MLVVNHLVVYLATFRGLVNLFPLTGRETFLGALVLYTFNTFLISCGLQA